MADVDLDNAMTADFEEEYDDNVIVIRAKTMSRIARNIYLFTRGEGPLKTASYLFAQAEHFGEAATFLYDAGRGFACEVPDGSEKKELIELLKKIPCRHTSLRAVVNSNAVGKSAMLDKINFVIQAANSLMNEIAALLSLCSLCARKFGIAVVCPPTAP